MERCNDEDVPWKQEGISKNKEVVLMKRHISKEVQCPFYHSEEPQKICCEGVQEESTIHLCFSTPTQQKMYKGVFCNNKYKKCYIADMLFKKYEE